jgi:hypothetical protein
VPYTGKYTLSKESMAAWAEILLTGEKYTNLEKVSTTTKMAVLPHVERVRGPTKSIKIFSIGWEEGLALCSPT